VEAVSALGKMALQYSHPHFYGDEPFQVVYGRAPPSLADYIPGAITLHAVESVLLDRTDVLHNLKNILHKAQTTMKEIADQKWAPHHFHEGDLVFVKLRHTVRIPWWEDEFISCLKNTTVLSSC